MSTHNICFRGEIRKILCRYPLLSVAMICVFADYTGLMVGFVMRLAITVNVLKFQTLYFIYLFIS